MERANYDERRKSERTLHIQMKNGVYIEIRPKSNQPFGDSQV